MSSRLPDDARDSTENDTEIAPRHIQVVGGSPADWRALSDAQWAQRLADLGKVADHAGASWLIVRPFGTESTGNSSIGQPEARTLVVGGCLVVADPEPDGRARLTRVIAGLGTGGASLADAAIMAAINAPAETDPDLVVVLGSGHELPGSMVWELAYCELVFVDIAWSDLHGSHLADALSTFSHRHRRFGGLD